jgi:phage terminase small subunit
MDGGRRRERGQHSRGWAPKPPQNAVSQASRLSTKANVQAALEAGYKDRQTRTQVTADITVREISRLAHADIRKFYDEHGQLRPLHELPDDLAACIASIEVVRRKTVGTVASAGSETGQAIEVIYKIKLWNKPRALELLGRHQGLFKDEQQAPVSVPAFILPKETPGVSVH